MNYDNQMKTFFKNKNIKEDEVGDTFITRLDDKMSPVNEKDPNFIPITHLSPEEQLEIVFPSNLFPKFNIVDKLNSIDYQAGLVNFKVKLDCL